jgi:hypothetical protein
MLYFEFVDDEDEESTFSCFMLLAARASYRHAFYCIYITSISNEHLVPALWIFELPQASFRVLLKAVIGVGVELTTSVAAMQHGGASETEKDSYLQKGVRGLVESYLVKSSGESAEPSGSPSSEPNSASLSSLRVNSLFSAVGDCPTESTAHIVCESGGLTYAVHARSTVTFDGAISTVDGGDVGVSPGTSITAVETIAHKGGTFTTESADFASYVMSAHTAALAMSPTTTTSMPEIGGQTFTPGVHNFDVAVSIAFGTTVTLDGQGDPNSQFVFKAGTTLITAADTFFILINGAKAENILWALGNSATLGARSVLEGSILAGTAITFGAQSELRGCALAQTAITFSSAGSVNLRSQPLPVCSDQSLSQSVCADFAVHARTTASFAAGSIVDGGLVGVSPGTSITGAALVTFLNGGAVSPDSTDFAFSVAFAHSAAIAHRVDSIYMGTAVEIGGQTFTPGTYRIGTSMSLASSSIVTLDGEGDPNSKFFFQTGSSFTTGTGSKVNLINGAKAENVVWGLGSAAIIGIGSIIQGSILTGTSIAFGARSEVHGCALAMSAISVGSSGAVYLPSNVPSASQPSDSSLSPS